MRTRLRDFQNVMDAEEQQQQQQQNDIAKLIDTRIQDERIIED